MGLYHDHVEYLLEEWGKWANQNTIKLGIKTGVLGRIHGSTVKAASISELDAETIDAALSEMGLLDPALRKAAKLIFKDAPKCGYNYSAIAAKLRAPRGHVPILKHSIINYVAGSLPNRFKKMVDGYEKFARVLQD